VNLNLKSLLGSSEDDLQRELVQLREEEAEFRRGIGRSLGREHRRLDQAAETWRAQLLSLISGGPPTHPNQQTFAVVANLVSLLNGLNVLHAALDELAAEGKFDARPQDEIDATLARLEQEIRTREAALEAKQAEARAEQARADADALQRRVEEVVGK
jgi:hypothetical protein